MMGEDRQQQAPRGGNSNNLATDSVSVDVVLSVAQQNGVDPTALPPLGETVDPDALDALVPVRSRDGSTAEVSFTYAGHDVTIDGNGEVTLQRTELAEADDD